MNIRVVTHLFNILIVLLSTNFKLSAQNLYLSEKEAIEDLKVFIDVLDHHPGAHLYRTEREIDSLKQNLASGITDSISFDEFYSNLLQSLVFLKDGHTGLSLGSKYSDAKRSSTTLPFRYKIIDKKLYIIDTLTTGLDDLLYSQIISVNNISSDSILNHFYKYTTADNNNEVYRMRYNERIFGQNFDFFFGVCNEYAIDVIALNGDTLHKTVHGIEDYELKVNLNNPKPLICSFVEENDLAILTVNTFGYRRIVESGQDFHKFIDDFFKKVSKKKIQNIVIDVRENWGGAGGLAMGLYAYLFPVDFKWVDHSYTYLDGNEKFAKFSQLPDGQYNFLKNHDTIRISDHRLKVTNGLESKTTQSSTKIPFGPKKKMKDISKNKFSGNLFVLTSGITFSAGSIFASKCTEREKTVIIGEPTGSAAGVFCGGGYLIVSLPNSGFKFDLPIMERHVALSNKSINPNKPVKPDYLIETNLNNFIENVDPEMNKVYELIKK